MGGLTLNTRGLASPPLDDDFNECVGEPTVISSESDILIYIRQKTRLISI